MPRAIHVFRTPDRFVAGTVGQPGNRTFYLQAVHDNRVDLGDSGKAAGGSAR